MRKHERREETKYQQRVTRNCEILRAENTKGFAVRMAIIGIVGTVLAAVDACVMASDDVSTHLKICTIAASVLTLLASMFSANRWRTAAKLNIHFREEAEQKLTDLSLKLDAKKPEDL